MVRRAAGNDVVELALHLHWETEKALLVSDTGIKDAAVWLPKSKIEFEIGERGAVTVTLPEWLAIERGLA